MAGRKRASTARTGNFNTSLYMWLGIAAVIAVMALTFYMFGFDIGIVSVPGHMNSNMAIWAGVLCIVAAYVADVQYTKVAREFFDAPAKWTRFIPYAGVISLFDTWALYVSLGLILIALVIALVMFTSVGQILPLDVLQFGYEQMIVAALTCMGIFSIIRGAYFMIIKKEALALHEKHIHETGTGGKFSKLTYISYFIPIARMISIYTDINLLRNIKADLDSMTRLEEN